MWEAILAVLGLSAIQGLDAIAAKGLRKRISEIVSKIQSALQTDNEKFSEFLNANSEKRNAILSTLVTTMGYGPVVDSLRSELRTLKEQKETETRKHQKYQEETNKELNRQYEKQNASNTAVGAFVQGSVDYATGDNKTADAIDVSGPQYGTPAQNVQGGLH